MGDITHIRESEDFLDDILIKHEAYYRNYILEKYSDRLGKTPYERAIQMLNAAAIEIGETQVKLGFKWWKQKPQTADSSDIKEEIVDILHFIFNACIELDMDAFELYHVYINKLQKNVDRQREGY